MNNLHPLRLSFTTVSTGRRTWSLPVARLSPIPFARKPADPVISLSDCLVFGVFSLMGGNGSVMADLRSSIPGGQTLKQRKDSAVSVGAKLPWPDNEECAGNCAMGDCQYSRRGRQIKGAAKSAMFFPSSASGGQSWSCSSNSGTCNSDWPNSDPASRPPEMIILIASSTLICVKITSE